MRRLPFISALVGLALGRGQPVIPGDRRPMALRDMFRRRRGNGGRFTRAMRKAFAEHALERYGLDVTGDKATVTDCRRRLRNARKQERRAAR